MKISVVVAAYNAEKTLRRCLAALQNQTYQNFELVVIDDGSTDGTAALLASFPERRLRVVHNSQRQGIARTRNVGIQQAQGELIFFTDADCLPLPQWLEAGVKHIGHADFITGWTLYENSYPSYQDRVVQGKDVFFTCNLGFRKESLQAVGGFDEQFNMYGEDKDVCYRILKNGGKKTFCEQMMVIHQRSLRTPQDELRRYKNYYLGKLFSQLRHGQEKDISFHIIRPDALAVLLFPPVLLITRSFRSFTDVKLLPFTWLGMLYGRAALWKEALRQGTVYL